MNDTNEGKPTVILEVGAEGGTLTVEGQQGEDDAWRFRFVRDEGTLDDFLPGEFSPEELHETSDWVATLNETFASIDRWPWARLYALRIQADFADQVLEAVRARLSAVRTSERSRLWARGREVAATAQRDRAARADRASRWGRE